MTTWQDIGTVRKPRVSYEMRRVLKKIGRDKGATPKDCRCGYRTFVALEQRGLIRVETTFSSISNLRTAFAWITERGRALLPSPPSKEGE